LSSYSMRCIPFLKYASPQIGHMIAYDASQFRIRVKSAVLGLRKRTDKETHHVGRRLNGIGISINSIG